MSIIFFLSSKNNILIIKGFASGIEYELKYCKIENYLKLCDNNKFKIDEKVYKKVNNPKVSIISPIFNRERFIIRLFNSIRYQKFEDIEIILIDDYSTDNSVNIIKKLMKNDKRIILLKNRKTKGTLISRNIGSIYSKGKYLIFPDPDDIISKDILRICYKVSEKYNYEIIKFNLYLGNKELHYEKYSHDKANIEIYQPELSMHCFYGGDELKVIDSNLANKFIKKETYLRALNIISKFYLNEYMISMEDSMINFILHRTARSLYYIKTIGYYYIKHSQSITNNEFNLSFLRIKFGFLYLKLLLEYTKNVKYEKDIINILFNRLNKKIPIQTLSSFNGLNYKFLYNIINIFLSNKFVPTINKKIFSDLKNNIKNYYKK